MIPNPEDQVPSLILRLESLDDDLTSDPEPDAVTQRMVDITDAATGSTSAPAAAHPLAHWQAAAEAASDACLVLDAGGAVVSASPAALEVLGVGDAGVRGRRLLDVIDVVDFDTAESNPDYAARITPLATLNGRGLMRSLMRLRQPDGTLTTLDSTSAPLHDEGGNTIGSISFFATFATL
jgi:PAS domain S-box-containing protein